MAETFRSIARIAKTHGRRGEVVAVPADGLPPMLVQGMRVALVPPNLKGPRWRTIRSLEERRGGQLVSFEGVVTLDDAMRLVGKAVLARKSDLPDNFGLRDAPTLLGREVCDGRLGSLGYIEEVLLGPANDVWVVRGGRGEVLVPAVSALVVHLPDEGTIMVELPRGLVDEGQAP